VITLAEQIERPFYVPHADSYECYCAHQVDHMGPELNLQGEVLITMKTASGSPLLKTLLLKYEIPKEIDSNGGDFTKDKIYLSTDPSAVIAKGFDRSIRGEIVLTVFSKEEHEAALKISATVEPTAQGGKLIVSLPPKIEGLTRTLKYSIFKESLFGMFKVFSDGNTGAISDDRRKHEFSLPRSSLAPRLNYNIEITINTELINGYDDQDIKGKIKDLFE